MAYSKRAQNPIGRRADPKIRLAPPNLDTAFGAASLEASSANPMPHLPTAAITLVNPVVSLTLAFAECDSTLMSGNADVGKR